jgi:hypothetical protein
LCIQGSRDRSECPRPWAVKLEYPAWDSFFIPTSSILIHSQAKAIQPNSTYYQNKLSIIQPTSARCQFNSTLLTMNHQSSLTNKGHVGVPSTNSSPSSSSVDRSTDLQPPQPPNVKSRQQAQEPGTMLASTDSPSPGLSIAYTPPDSPTSQRAWEAEERIVNARRDKKWPRTEWRQRGDDESRQHSKRKMLRRE